MRLPEIRYPLFWIGGLLVLGVAGGAVWPLTRPWRAAWNARWTRLVEDPPIPASPVPQSWAGLIPRQGLLLRDNIPATDQPGGAVVETIGRRLFVAIYDTWPLSGPPAHDRIGNSRRAFGWVPAEVVLPWPTRLVVQPASEPLSRPVLDWEADRLAVAVWSPAEPWSRVERIDRVARTEAGRPGVLVSRPELLALIRRLLAGESGETIRVRALFGQLAENTPLPPGTIEAARQKLPAWTRADHDPDRDDLVARLSRRNEQWTPEASWSGLEFVAIPLDDLP